jgi:chloride channel 7
MTKLRNHDVMIKPVKTIYLRSSVTDIVNVLTTTTHHGFPVIESEETPCFVGMISRSYLLLILKYIVIKKRVELTQKEIQHILEDLPRIDLNSLLSHLPSEETFVDLGSFMNRSTLTISELATVSTTFELFRSMSLRHLPVVNKKNHVVGFITRKDLMHERIEHIYEKNKHNIKPPKLLYRFRQ